MAPTLGDVAEDAFAYIAGPSIEFDRRQELVLRNMPNPHPLFGMALRPRLQDVSAAVDYARAWFADRGREGYTWLVSNASRPRDLADRLLGMGAVPDPNDPVYTGMVLERAPVAVDGVEVRKVTTFEDHAGASELTWQSFDFTEEQKVELRTALRERWESSRAHEVGDRFVALLDGEIVGSGGTAYLQNCVYLLGGNVAEGSRGRGVYRALVRARWDEAVARGTPALVVQAGNMSRPILERLGFEPVCTIDALVDTCP
jgi:GNAT superfamily N-acetyltransferase